MAAALHTAPNTPATLKTRPADRQPEQAFSVRVLVIAGEVATRLTKLQMSRMANECRQRVYDHRLRDLVRQTGDLSLATAAGVPRSTATGWLRRDLQPVVSIDVLDMAEADLRAEVLKLRRRVRTLSAVLGLLVAALRVPGNRRPRIEFSDRTTRARLLRAASRARKVLPASAVPGHVRK